eukprot:CAMPEP_0119125602 /NCGR_PEP_ID=MMETSP1310-20130426/4819_1 /TAXON_ID=464262 /ORGANISM="Genus nov. species nov., Strain RCC2339" /LENGTH=335 /DNA_ID=CAMNT_0007115685 /DNA_START=161 /DNA_END=1168 /DNA_ORIENTATION=+
MAEVVYREVVVLYEHPSWFDDLFAFLEERSITHARVHVSDIKYCPDMVDGSSIVMKNGVTISRDKSLVLNRVSAVPHHISEPSFLPYYQNFLRYLELLGVPVVNGSASYAVGLSKALQYTILQKNGAKVPRSRVVRSQEEIVDALGDLQFPILFKPNTGGSGAGIIRWTTRDEAEAEFSGGTHIPFGLDGVGLLQEYHRPKGGCIYRVEILNHEFLYGLVVPVLDGSFNYCPADGCNIDRAQQQGAFNQCPLERKKAGALDLTPYAPTPEEVDVSKRTLSDCSCDLGSVEFLISERDGEHYYFDVNPLSNFVGNAKELVDTNPYERLLSLILVPQ